MCEIAPFLGLEYFDKNTILAFRINMNKRSCHDHDEECFILIYKNIYNYRLNHEFLNQYN